MSNSKLISYTKISPNKTKSRKHSIDRITPHCVVGQLSAESIGNCFVSPTRKASCNYGICKDIRYDYREYNDDGTPVEESRYVVTDDDGNPVYDYALRYQDFIFLTIHMVQKLFIKMEKIETEMNAMKKKNAL